MRPITKLTLIVVINFLILTVALFWSGTCAATYIGSALFLFQGLYHSQITKKDIHSILSFLIPILLFTITIFVILSLVANRFGNNGLIDYSLLKGAVYIVLPFTVFFTAGWLISLIRIKRS